MNNKRRRTLALIFVEPVSGTLEWSSIEALLVAVGCDIIEGSGSRVRFSRNGNVETFHRPYPAKEAKRYQMRAVREYLVRMGIQP